MPEQQVTSVQLSDELRFTIALVSKIANLNPPSTLRTSMDGQGGNNVESSVYWWKPAANAWFQD
ncbi:hypothetical protein FRC09_016219, partial [Ceratobasidium sp. 395]